MEAPYSDVVILSDLHLGSETSRAREAVTLLRSLNFRRLILLGDIFCDLNFRRLNKEHWHFLSYIRKLSNPKRGVEVIWVEGNHDYGLEEVMSHLVGVPVYQKYMWDSAGERHLAIHGHQFDKFVARNPVVLGEIATLLYLNFQKLDRGRRLFSRMLDRLNTRWQRLTSKVCEGALAYATAWGATRVYCGHTHESITIARNGVHYYNTGAWTNVRPTYVTICGREIAIHEYLEGADDCYPGKERGDAVAAPAEFTCAPGLFADAEYEGVPS
jgi:UDP-2,3-diacylglucosamine pyrophosphatase LpxH